MPNVLRLVLLLAAIAGAITLVAQFSSGSRDHADAVVPTERAVSSRSVVTLDRDGDWLVVRYDLVADDAIVIRLSDDAMRTCNFKIHTGPDSGRNRIKSHIRVDHEIVPAAEWETAVARLGRACAEYWYSHD